MVFNIYVSKYLLVLLINIGISYEIFPPPYSVNLSQDETFVISELLEDKDVQDVYDEDEMIRKEDLLQRINANTDKYYRIHRQVSKYNSKASGRSYNSGKSVVFMEHNPDVEESVPWRAGFVDNNGNFMPEEGIIYFDGESVGKKFKRLDDELQDNNDSVNYDYKSFKEEYENHLKAAEKANDTLKYTTIKEDESVKDAAKELVDFKKMPKNCTVEEMKGIGWGAMECLFTELDKPRMRSAVFEKALRILVIWIVLYAVVATACWCQYGWCCCCCRCKFCRPKENIAKIQTFFANNPVGIYHDEKGNLFTYKPTNFEKYAYKKLEKELNRL